MDTARSRADSLNVAEAGPLTIVGIGASAGGLEAFRHFFSNMPNDSGMAFVVVLHLPPNRPSLLPEILSRWTRMPVRSAKDGDRVEANTVYVPPPHWTVEMKDGRLCISEPPADTPREHRPIDGFFDTLAASLREHAVGVVLSGTGSDGALGLKAIRSCGGLTVVQGRGEDADGEPIDGPEYGDMPAGAIATGAVDLVAPVQDIPGHLLRLRGMDLENLPFGTTDEDAEALRLHICTLLRAQVGHDFSGYKVNTFMRRVGRRMQVLDVGRLADYVDRLQQDPDEAVLLFRELLIRVTSFFRDTDTFELIERLVIPRLFQGRHADGVVRIWVPGCSTGEEAYSLGMLLLEHVNGLRAAPRVQIFATDIDEPAISTARMGRYPTVLLEGLSTERRDRFFTRSDSGYIVSKELRAICTFSPHSLVRDPPFSRIDLISCRNLLIYLDAHLQSAILPAFHYSLVPNGILVLGSSESTGRHEGLFDPIDKRARIFQRRNVRSPKLELSTLDRERLAHPGRWLQHHAVPGDKLPAASRTRFQPHAAAASPNPPAAPSEVEQSTLARLVRLAARRFHPEVAEAEQLRHALDHTRTELDTVSEEHGTALEELRSSNEELHSVNEELQSTNEELETSKEEIQSVNEELHTVNTQLSDKVDELDRTNNDLRNLFDSTQIATIFLDRNMLVRSFTPAASGIYNLIAGDVGRPLSDIVTTLKYVTLREDTRQVLATLEPLERRVAKLDGSRHYILRVLPYRGPDSTVSGTLVTFLDVTSVVAAEHHQRLLVDELNHRVKNMLTVVISLASQTARRAADLPAFQDAFMGRVRALAASYALLSRESWISIGLRDVVEEELAPFATAGRINTHLTGEAVQLSPAGALALGMAFHELATNAVKYGALSTQEGSIAVNWWIESAGEPELAITWHEQGGPPVLAPERTGFGTMLIRRSLADELSGGADLDFRPSGLHAMLRAPLSRVTPPFAAESAHHG